ncbi:restriction endonuclease subunit S [Listeria farberi]|uniref:Restriction endonuclease subunit S n=1 Tax=Listeria farberi TaxID=2713500 RepID=A0A7X0ZJ60_9LIST|nr:restriction endonuclease subunit S [Listeria farberi]MBC1376339.1 restriction endonuclease subunit S [Listeria farberi]MBC1380044.1 restriction endonuclease subunit S [Listeria farberi]MBC2288173.1 restriction endonuclease subunit S [Listeria farberi]
MSHINKRVPKRRFMEFNNAVAWEQHKVLELGEIITGNTPSTTNKDYYKGQYLFVSPADIQDNRYVSKTNTTVTELGFKTGRFIRKGSILFVSIGSTIGKVGQADLDLITNQQINSIIPSNNYDDDFVYSNLLGISAKVKQLAAIQAVPIINKTELGKTLINNPSLEEQTKIGLFFKKLDNTIALHQRKLEKIKALKTAYLSEMFPAEGETKPKRRFAGFTDDWEQRELGEESDVRDGTHDSPKYFDDGYPLVTSKNLKEFGLDLSDVSLISDKDFRAINKRSKVDIGDILFGMIGTIGNPVQIDRDDFAIKNVALIKEQKKILNSFLIQVLKSQVFNRYIRNENAGGTQKFLSLSKVREFRFLCPNIEEQTRIGNFFKQIDDTITLHQRKLQKLQNIKKAYLNEMFI